jgi:sigma-B regulation protein RsbU (phosphoserine phosphatase)
MPKFLRKAEIAITRRVRRNPPQGFVARSAFWLGLIFAALLLLHVLHIWRDDGSTALLILLGMPLSILVLILLWRWIFRRVLWRVRNRLVVTYLLMGLAPVTLFFTLALIASYLFSGQFATFAAFSELNTKQKHLNGENNGFAIHIGLAVPYMLKTRIVDLPELQDAAAAEIDPKSLDVGAELDGEPITLVSDGKRYVSKVKLPPWAARDFHGVALEDGKVFIRAVDSRWVGTHRLTVHTSLPVSNAMLEQMATDLGRMSIVQAFDLENDDINNPSARIDTRPENKQEKRKDVESVAGGRLPSAAHFYDLPVPFSAPFAVTDWRTGKSVSGLLFDVQSRPTLLYKRLFGNSVQVGAIVRDMLITIAILFGLLELFALIMAIGLSRTITKSISDLYGATRAIDAGQLEHRIVVTRRDQLAALSTSFNTMAQSLAHLLEQQREKERLQTELAIAQEVQNSLLPQGQIRLPMLEVHGVSKPARSVSGDYYDFLLTGPLQLCLALGDISGKGISAALLMASLHSAVRAYRFGDSGPGSELADGEPNLLASPALMLERLNRHLFTSTQPEKYATLFLAYYDGADHSLTYSTGGQLPPLVLCANGEVKRLDCGGSVVGLLDGMKYEQATVTLSAGDIVIIYSDGVTEPENEFGDFGEDRLLDLVRRNRTQSLEAISATVMQSLRAWIGDQEQPDDITLVLARQL